VYFGVGYIAGFMESTSR